MCVISKTLRLSKCNRRTSEALKTLSCFPHHPLLPLPSHLPGELDVVGDYCATPWRLIFSSVWRLSYIRQRGHRACQSCHFESRHLQFLGIPQWVTHRKRQSEHFASIRWERGRADCPLKETPSKEGFAFWFICVLFNKVHHLKTNRRASNFFFTLGTFILHQVPWSIEL